MKSSIIISLVGVASILCSAALPAYAKDNILTLSNLERERAALINDILNPKLDF